MPHSHLKHQILKYTCTQTRAICQPAHPRTPHSPNGDASYGIWAYSFACCSSAVRLRNKIQLKLYDGFIFIFFLLQWGRLWVLCFASLPSLYFSDPTCLIFLFHFVPTFFFFFLLELYLFSLSMFLFLPRLQSNLYWAMHNHRPSGHCGERWARSSSHDQTRPPDTHPHTHTRSHL